MSRGEGSRDTVRVSVEVNEWMHRIRAKHVDQCSATLLLGISDTKLTSTNSSINIRATTPRVIIIPNNLCCLCWTPRLLNTWQKKSWTFCFMFWCLTCSYYESGICWNSRSDGLVWQSFKFIPIDSRVDANEFDIWICFQDIWFILIC